MSLNVSAWAIRTPAPSIVLFIVLFAAGVVAFTWLSVTKMPNVDLPVVSVSVRQAVLRTRSRRRLPGGWRRRLRAYLA